jgi:AraC-like DNA-binding protein
MSQPTNFSSDHLKLSGEPAPGPAYVEHTTNQVRPSERLSFWRDSVLRRMEPVAFRDAASTFNGRMRMLHGDNVVLVEHTSDGLVARRDRLRAARDGGDEIGLDLMVHCESALLDQGGEHKVRAGEFRILDYGQPLRVIRSRHRAIGLMLPRRLVVDAVGASLKGLTGRTLPMTGPMTGLTVLLAEHLRVSMDGAPRMTAPEQVLAANTAAQLALTILRGEWPQGSDPKCPDRSLDAAAQRVIERDCHDPDLTPARIAAILGCSRASLYRVFSSGDASVAEAIWISRLEMAARLLSSASHRNWKISDIAYQSGFLDQNSFSRMFKRRFGRTPSEAR